MRSIVFSSGPPRLDGGTFTVRPPAGGSLALARLPDGTDRGNNAADFGFGTQTPNAPNVAAPVP